MSQETNVVDLATELTIAWLSNPNARVEAKDVPGFLTAMHGALISLGDETDVPATAATDAPAPKVSVRKSLADPAFIVSMIDGKPYKSLRRHLTTHGLTPDDYRGRFGLKPDYPMVAPDYSAVRRAMAKKIGLGRKPGKKQSPAARASTPAAPAPGSEAAVGTAPKRGRQPKVMAEA